MKLKISRAASNVFFNSIEGALFLSGMVFFHQNTILIAFIKKTFDSPVLVALIPALLTTGINLPGILTTRIAEQYPYRKKFILIFGFIQRMAILLMALSTLLFVPTGAKAMTGFVLLFYFCFAFSGGVSFPAWIDFYAKTVPLRFRARTTAIRNALSGVAGILLPLWIAVILARESYPANYRQIFLLGFCFLLLSYICFCQIREEKASPLSVRQNYHRFLQSLLGLLRQNKNFRRFLTARLIWCVTACGPAFYTAYAIDLLRVPDSTVALYTFFLNISIAVSGMILGYIGDKFGNLKIQWIGAISSTLELLLVIFFPSDLVFKIVFLLYGISYSANSNAMQVLTTEFGTDRDRIRYSTISGFLSGTTYGLIPVLAGVLLSLNIITLPVLFMFCAGCSLLALGLYIFTVKDPRSLPVVEEVTGENSLSV